jgi:hypothetical protein
MKFLLTLAFLVLAESAFIKNWIFGQLKENKELTPLELHLRYYDDEINRTKEKIRVATAECLRDQNKFKEQVGEEEFKKHVKELKFRELNPECTSLIPEIDALKIKNESKYKGSFFFMPKKIKSEEEIQKDYNRQYSGDKEEELKKAHNDLWKMKDTSLHFHIEALDEKKKQGPQVYATPAPDYDF